MSEMYKYVTDTPNIINDLMTYFSHDKTITLVYFGIKFHKFMMKEIFHYKLSSRHLRAVLICQHIH